MTRSVFITSPSTTAISPIRKLPMGTTRVRSSYRYGRWNSRSCMEWIPSLASFSARALPTPLIWVTEMSSSDAMVASGFCCSHRSVGFGLFNDTTLAGRQRQHINSLGPGESDPPGQGHRTEGHRGRKRPHGQNVFLVFDRRGRGERQNGNAKTGSYHVTDGFQ